MLLFLDMFFYMIYNLSRKMGRGEFDSKMSAIILVGIYYDFLLLAIASIIGLIWDNKMSRWIFEKNNGFWITISTGFLILYMLFIRYFRRVNMKELSRRIEILQKPKKMYLKILIYFFILIIPIAWYISLGSK